MGKRKLISVIVVVGLFLVGLASVALADGTETLGDPSISVATGSGIVVAGAGLEDSQPASISINVPGTVKQALLYWGGAVTSDALSDDTVLLDGNNIVGQPIGGPAFFYSAFGKSFYFSNFRADITPMVSSGANVFSIEGLDNKDADGHGENNGAGILVIYDDGTTSEIGLKDGTDLAFFGFPEPRKSTVPQTFNFAPDSADRTATFSLFAGSVGEAGVEFRTSTIRMATDLGPLPDIYNLLGSVDGNQWDSHMIPVTIPAGATQLTVEVLSGDGGTTSGFPASIDWIVGGLSVPSPDVPTPTPTPTDTPPPTATNTPTPTNTPPPDQGCTRTVGYWKTHPNDWPVDEITIGGITYTKAQARAILRTPPRGDATYILAHQLIAAKLNVLSGADDSSIASTIVAADSWLVSNPLGSNPTGPARQEGIALALTLDMYNNGDIGPGHCDSR